MSVWDILYTVVLFSISLAGTGYVIWQFHEVSVHYHQGGKTV